MKPIIQWIFTISAGAVMGMQTWRMLKVANEENESHFARIMDRSAIQSDSDLPFILGSEKLSSALQHILSSDDNLLGNRPIFINDVLHTNKPDYELGSESLNRTLEEIMSNTGCDDAELMHFQPAIRA